MYIDADLRRVEAYGRHMVEEVVHLDGADQIPTKREKVEYCPRDESQSRGILFFLCDIDPEYMIG
jgi:hypothetical protein